MLPAFFAGLLLIVGADQLTKYFVVSALKPIIAVPVIPDVFHLTYVENRGAGFGMFSDFTWLLTVFSAFVAAALIAYVLIKRPKSYVMLAALTFLCGGAIGNLIDRVRLGYVVDFLDFTLIHFPVFNVADCFVTVGAILLAVYVLFFAEEKTRPNPPEKTDEKEPF